MAEESPVWTKHHYILSLRGLAALALSGANKIPEALDQLKLLREGLNEDATGPSVVVPEVSVTKGYAAWAETYEEQDNILISIEQPVMHKLFAEIPPGTALDFGCGTGRHTAELVRLGFRVFGVDACAEMLEKAKARVPSADFKVGGLDNLFVSDSSVDLIVCGLVLSHVVDVVAAMTALGRKLRPGGIIIISNPHPVATKLLRWRVSVTLADGTKCVIPEYPHWPCDYIKAFTKAGLTVKSCYEPKIPIGKDETVNLSAGLPGAIIWMARKPYTYDTAEIQRISSRLMTF